MTEFTAVLRPLVAHTLRQAAQAPPPQQEPNISRRRFIISYTYSFLTLIIIASFLFTSYNFDDLIRLFFLNATADFCDFTNSSVT